jgi:hypothetical protein
MRSTDDRGKPVTLHSLSFGAISEPDASTFRITPTQAKRLHSLKNRNFMESVLAVGLLAISIFVTTWGLHAAIIGLMTFMIATVAFFVTLTSTTRRYNRLNAVSYLPSRLICPACEHSMRGLSPEKDGCTVCPECGAAWNVPAPISKASP